MWGSWAVIDDRGRSFWFAGDTAYADVFQQIGNRFGGFDLAAIPIGDFTFTAICKAFKGAQSPWVLWVLWPLSPGKPVRKVPK